MHLFSAPGVGSTNLRRAMPVPACCLAFFLLEVEVLVELDQEGHPVVIGLPGMPTAQAPAALCFENVCVPEGTCLMPSRATR